MKTIITISQKSAVQMRHRSHISHQQKMALERLTKQKSDPEYRRKMHI